MSAGTDQAMEAPGPRLTLELRLGGDVVLRGEFVAREDVSLPSPGEVPVWRERVPTKAEMAAMGAVICQEAGTAAAAVWQVK
jgi:hypothetical protein